MNFDEPQNNNLVVIKTYVYLYNFLLPHAQTPQPLILHWAPGFDEWCIPKILQFVDVVNWTMRFPLWEQDCNSCWVILGKKAAFHHLWMVPSDFKHCLHTYYLAAYRRKPRTIFFSSLSCIYVSLLQWLASSEERGGT